MCFFFVALCDYVCDCSTSYLFAILPLHALNRSRPLKTTIKMHSFFPISASFSEMSQLFTLSGQRLSRKSILHFSNYIRTNISAESSKLFLFLVQRSFEGQLRASKSLLVFVSNHWSLFLLYFNPFSAFSNFHSTSDVQIFTSLVNS